MVAMIVAAGTEVGPAQWLPTYMEQVFTWPGSAGALALLAFNILMALGRFGVSGLAHRVKPPVLPLIATPACAACLLGGSTARSAGTAAISLAVLGLGVSCLWPGTLGYAADRFPAGGATMFSMLVATGTLGAVLAPAVIGALADWRGLRWGMASMAWWPLLAGLIYLWRLWAERPQSSPSDHPDCGACQSTAPSD